MFDVIICAYFLIQPGLKMFLYRLRGMSNAERHDSLNDTAARLLFWGIPFAVDAALIAILLHERSLVHIGVIFLLCGLAGWLAACIRHADWQSPSGYNFFIMGCITTGMLGIMLLPLICYDISMLAFVPLGMLGWLASAFAYSGPLKDSTLTLFGITFCRPIAIGGSEWEEFFVGGFPFGVAIAVIGIKSMGLI